MTGFLLIDKPQGKTSYGAVAAIKHITGEKRVGHTGTLDPMATGVLPVLIGRATALSGYLTDADKRYTARVRLGTVTDTCDITGKILSENPVAVRDGDLAAVLRQFTGEIEQQPPMFSALKKDGVRLYQLARKGITAEIPTRTVWIREINLLSPIDDKNEFEIDVLVSKGTYIRSLARDIGEALGCGATLKQLKRTQTCGFDLTQCVPLEQLTADNLSQYLLPAQTAVSALPAVSVTEKQAIRFCNGGQLDLDRLPIAKAVDRALWRVESGDTFLGLGEICSERNELAVKCVIAERSGELR